MWYTAGRWLNGSAASLRNPSHMKKLPRASVVLSAALAALGSFRIPVIQAQDVSAPAILQYFESSYGAIEGRMADIHAAGYGSMYTPPPGRAEGGTSVGYDQYDRLAGLIDIAQEKNYQMIRSPVDANDPHNIRAGSIAYNGRIANLPDPNNARFYPDKALAPITVSDPTTGQSNIKIYPFNNT